MQIKTRLQLSTLMFLQYFIWGTWYVTLNTYLGEGLGFTATQIGLCYGTFAISAMIYTGIILHRICYDFFFVTAQIYVDKKAPDHLKSSAQGLITFATYGLGMFIGTWFAGRTIDMLTFDGLPDWARIWYVPAVLAAVVLLMFVFLFREKKGEREPVKSGRF